MTGGSGRDPLKPWYEVYRYVVRDVTMLVFLCIKKGFHLESRRPRRTWCIAVSQRPWPALRTSTPRLTKRRQRLFAEYCIKISGPIRRVFVLSPFLPCICTSSSAEVDSRDAQSVRQIKTRTCGWAISLNPRAQQNRKKNKQGQTRTIR